jgi:hypothetical protein
MGSTLKNAWNELPSGLDKLAVLLSAIGSLVVTISGALSWFGLPGADTPQFRFSTFVILITGALSVVLIAIATIVLFARPGQRYVRHVWRLAAVLSIATVGLGTVAYQSTYRAHIVDWLSFGDKPTIQNIAFDADGTLVAAEFNTELRLRDLTTRAEAQVPWQGVSNDRLQVRRQAPQVSIVRLIEGDDRRAIIWSWSPGSEPESRELRLGRSSNSDPTVQCTPEDWALDGPAQRIALAYKCELKDVQQQAGGFVEVVSLVSEGTPPPATRMQRPGIDHPEVPTGQNCTPKRVIFNDDARYVVGMYSCITDNTFAYHVKRWSYDTGEFQQAASVLQGVEKWTLLRLHQTSRGDPRIAAQRGSRVELWEPADGVEAKLVSWLDYNTILGFAPQNVALSPDGRWLADYNSRRDGQDATRRIAIQQFGLWFGDRWRADRFDGVWENAQRAVDHAQKPSAAAASSTTR